MVDPRRRSAAGAVALAFVLAPEDTPAVARQVSDAEAQAIVAAALHGVPRPARRRRPASGWRRSTQMRANASQIERQVSSRAMPPGNATGLTDDERAQLVAWAAAAR